MVYASNDLKHEHDGILHGLKILESMIELLKENNDLDPMDFWDMVDFFRLFADKCHHGKEEQFFFPALEKAGVKNQNGPIGQMLLEHAEGRKYIAGMSEALQTNKIEKTAFIEQARHYIDLLRQHINKENNILFPLGDKSIPIEEQSELLLSFELFEENVMGVGTHERLHEMLHRYEEKYLHPH